MKRFALTICLAACLVFVCGATAMAVNSVTAASVTVLPGATNVVVGLSVVNDVSLTGFVLPIECRDTDGNGSYMTGNPAGFTFNIPAGNRFGASPLTGSVTKRLLGAPAAQTCSGPVSNSYAANSAIDNNSPDGVMWAGVSTNGEPDLYYLPAGDDAVAGTHVGWPDASSSTPYAAGPSFNLKFNVNAVQGTFEVDTMCVTPANHLSGTDLNTALVPFSFIMGVVTIYQPPNQCPDPLSIAMNPPPLAGTVGTPITKTLSATDPETDPITFYADKGVVVGDQWTYTPDCNDVPSFVVTITASDKGPTGCPGSTKQFTLTAAPAPLSLGCSNVTVRWNDADASMQATFGGGCPPYIFAVEPGSKGSIDGNGLWTYNQDCQDVAPAVPVTIRVTDAVQGTITCTFQFTVVNEAAVCAVIPSQLAPIGTLMTIDVSASGDPDPLTYTLVGANPLWNEQIVGNTYTGTRPATDVGVHTVTYTVSDNCAPAVECSFVLTFEKTCEQVTECIAIIGEGGYAYDSTLSGRNHTMYVHANAGSVPGLAGGFNFLICYDQSGLSFLGAGQTAALGWEYFTYRTGMFGGNCGSACPNGFVRLVGIADLNNGIALDGSKFEINGKDLAWLKFFVTADRNYINSCFHVKFCSIECGDNSISDSTGNILWIPCPGQNSNDITFGPDYPVVCPDFKYTPKELLKFCGGAICVREPNDDRGDINLNGIANEIGDAVLYTNYFIYGDIVWDPNPNYKESQILASDVNNDGIVLTVADLIYLIRIITGDAEPFPQGGAGHPKLSPYANSVNVISDVSDGALSVRTSSNVEVGGAVLVYRYSGVSVGTPVAAPGFEIKSRASNGELRMVVYGAKVSAGSNTLVTVPVNGNGTMELVESQFGDGNGALLTVNAAKVGPPKDYALLQNYPNPFNAGTVIPVALKDASEWSLSIYNVAGQVVRTFSGSSDAGTVNVAWDGKSSDGSSVATGVYFYRVTTPNFTATKKMVLLK